MDRRAAMGWLASIVLGGCGGSGAGSDATAGSNTLAPPATPASPVMPAAPAAPAAPEMPAPVVFTQNIAAWGDSLTPPFVVNLRLLYPARQIFDGGIAGQTSTEIAARQLADGGGHNSWINIFWYGHNNDKAPQQIKADLAASVAALAAGNTRFMILAVVNKANPDESKGGTGYDTIIRLNNDLAAAYPQNYLDIRAHLVRQYDPANAQDLVDFGNDVVPSSLRFDQIHLNNSGSIHVATKVKEFIDAKGW